MKNIKNNLRLPLILVGAFGLFISSAALATNGNGSTPPSKCAGVEVLGICVHHQF
jgi:hypothetical protein